MTTMTPDPNGMLMGGGGGRSAKFETEGDKIAGRIVRIDSMQRIDFKTKAPMTWPDGNKRMQLVVTIATDLHEDDEDDGERNIYIPIPSQLQKAVADAVRATGDTGLSAGGTLGVKFVSTAEPTQRGMNGAKQYQAQYARPQVSLDDAPPFTDDDEPIF